MTDKRRAGFRPPSASQKKLHPLLYTTARGPTQLQRFSSEAVATAPSCIAAVPCLFCPRRPPSPCRHYSDTFLNSALTIHPYCHSVGPIEFIDPSRSGPSRGSPIPFSDSPPSVLSITLLYVLDQIFMPSIITTCCPDSLHTTLVLQIGIRVNTQI